MELTYTKIGDYYYPNLCLPRTDNDRPLGKYGMLRKTYLKQNRPMMYDRLLLSPAMRLELQRLDAITTQTRMLGREGLETAEQVAQFLTRTPEQIKAVEQQRSGIYNRL